MYNIVVPRKEREFEICTFVNCFGSVNVTQSFLRTVYSFLVSLLFFCNKGLKKCCNSSSLSNNYIGETLPQNFYLISRKKLCCLLCSWKLLEAVSGLLVTGKFRNVLKRFKLRSSATVSHVILKNSWNLNIELCYIILLEQHNGFFMLVVVVFQEFP